MTILNKCRKFSLVHWLDTNTSENTSLKDKKYSFKMFFCTGEKRSLSYFKQGISWAIQRGNVASVLGTIPSDVKFEDIYYLN